MPITYVTRALTIEGKAFGFKAVVWECMDCGFKEAFSDMLDETNNREAEGGPRRAGWEIDWSAQNDGEECRCKGCAATHSRGMDA